MVGASDDLHSDRIVSLSLDEVVAAFVAKHRPQILAQWVVSEHPSFQATEDLCRAVQLLVRARRGASRPESVLLSAILLKPDIHTFPCIRESAYELAEGGCHIAGLATDYLVSCREETVINRLDDEIESAIARRPQPRTAAEYPTPWLTPLLRAAFIRSPKESSVRFQAYFRRRDLATGHGTQVAQSILYVGTGETIHDGVLRGTPEGAIIRKDPRMFALACRLAPLPGDRVPDAIDRALRLLKKPERDRVLKEEYDLRMEALFGGLPWPRDDESSLHESEGADVVAQDRPRLAPGVNVNYFRSDRDWRGVKVTVVDVLESEVRIEYDGVVCLVTKQDVFPI